MGKTTIFEGLRSGDLRDLVLPLISIDEYNSKLGNDKEVVVVAFFLKDEDPANDLSRFIEKGANHVLDTEPSPAPNEDGYYLVFVEFSRDTKFPEELDSLIGEIKMLVGIDEWTFKPYKHDEIVELNKKNVEKFVNLGKKPKKKEKVTNEDISEIFRNSFLDYYSLDVNGKLILEGFGTNREFTIIDIGDISTIMRMNGLGNSPLRLDETARDRCNSLEHMLGRAWSVVMISDHMLISDGTDRGILVKED